MVHKKLCIVGVHTLMLEFGDPGLFFFFLFSNRISKKGILGDHVDGMRKLCGDL